MLLSGCAQQQAISPGLQQEALAPLLCSSKPQCDLYWQRAQAWLVVNGAFRIQLANDTVIQTYGPLPNGGALAYRVTKLPTTLESARIVINGNCDNMLGCNPNLMEAAVSFKRFVTQSPTGALGIPSPSGTSSATVTAGTPIAVTPSKYAFSAEAFAKSRGCTSPVSTLNLKSSDSETFTLTCAKGDPMTVRCENGQCRALQ